MLALALLAPLIEVDWEAPDGCPDQQAFVERVERQADLQTQEHDAPVLTAEVVIRQLDERRWDLTMVLRSDDGSDHRRLEAGSCDAVVEAAAVVVSLRVVEAVPQPPVVPDPVGVPIPEPEPDPSPEPDAVAQPGPTPEPTAPDELMQLEGPVDAATPRPPRPQPQEPPPVGGWLAVQGGLALGVLPGVGGAIGLEGGAEGKWWRAGLGVQAAPARRRDHPQDRTVSGRFDLVSAEAFGCGVPVAGPVLFPLCGRFAAGAIRSVGEGAVDQPAPSWNEWLGLGASIGAAWRVTRWLAPFVASQFLVSLGGRSFSVGNVPGTLHETGPVAFRAWLGLEFHL